MAFVIFPESQAVQPPGEPVSPLTVGVVERVELEGGFFGIITETGEKLLPVHLPEKFKKSGLTVRLRYRELNNVMTARMWGKSVMILEIEEEVRPNSDLFRSE